MMEANFKWKGTLMERLEMTSSLKVLVMNKSFYRELCELCELGANIGSFWRLACKLQYINQFWHTLEKDASS